MRRAGEATSSGREEIFRVVLECLEEGIHVVDADGVTVFYNRAAAAIDNLNPSEVVGRPLLEVFPSLTVETSTLLRVLQSGQPETDRQQAFTNFKGDEITTVNSTYPIWGEAEDRDGGGSRRRLLGAVEVARDITRLKDLSERMLVLQRQLAGASSGRPGAPDEQEVPSAPGAVYTFEDIIGEGPAMRALKSLAAKAAQRQCPILVWGETGSGKELLVQAIHNAGPRRHRPFVAQNCAALPEPLLEGILFGTQKGGFTGAVDRPGLIELADGGTLFLDEIDSLQLNLQAKLLRVIQDRMVRRVGGTASRKVDVRFMAACGGDPQQAVAEGRLRADLFYRLNVVGLHVPPLRERVEDIPLLADFFIEKHNRQLGTSVKGMEPGVLSFFLAYEWPGNVRELEHAIQGALSLGESDRVRFADLPVHLKARAQAEGWWPPPQQTGAHGSAGGRGQPAAAKSQTAAEAGGDEISSGDGEQEVVPLYERLAAVERAYIQCALRKAGGNLSRAARLLGVPRQTLQYRLRRLTRNER